jgi:hypothetical protein
MPYHLLYRPYEAEKQPKDQIVRFFHAIEGSDIKPELEACPDAIPLELEAETISEALQEVRELGFR